MNELESKVSRLSALDSGISHNEIKRICTYIEHNRESIEKSTKPFVHLPSKSIGTTYPIRYNSKSREYDIFLDREKPMGSGAGRIAMKSLQYEREEIVVVKIAETKTPEKVERFMNDYHNLCRFEGQKGICPVYDFTTVKVNEFQYLEMVQKFYNQENLCMYLEQHTPTQSQIQSIILQILSLVVFFHKRKILIQDITPYNLLIHKIKDEIEVAHGDLETLKEWDKINLETFYYRMHPMYAPPEFWEMGIGRILNTDLILEDLHKADIWCLGGCLWLLLSETPLPWIKMAKEIGNISIWSFDNQCKMLEETLTEIIEPQDVNSIDHLIWEMLRIHPSERIGAEEALKKFKKL